MTRRLHHIVLCWLLSALLGLGAMQPVLAAEVAIKQAQIENTEDGYRLASSFAFDLNRGLEDAVERAFALYFTTDVEITRRRWYWLDEKTQVTAQTVRVSYNPLTRQYNTQVYHPGSSGRLRLQQNFNSLDEALALVRRPSRWVVAEKGALKTGETYQVAVRMRLDLAQLPKPFQVHAINNSDWRLASDWLTFNYRAEDGGK